jgi:hypothetical protein
MCRLSDMRLLRCRHRYGACPRSVWPRRWLLGAVAVDARRVTSARLPRSAQRGRSDRDCPVGDIAEAPRRRGRAAATRPERARVDAASRRSLLAHEAEAQRPSRRRQRSALPHWKRKRRVRQRGAWMPALVVRLLAGVPSGARGRRTPTRPVFRDAKPRWFGKRDFLRRNQLELP